MCHIELTDENRFPSKHMHKCKTCAATYSRQISRKYYNDPDKHPKIMEINNRYWDNLKNEIITRLGSKCVKCGFDNLLALQIDHVNGCGNQERRKYLAVSNHFKLTTCSGKYYRAIRDALRNGSTDYQLLCANCNMIKRRLAEIDQRKSRNLSSQ
jgi:hypothetical protein